MKEEARREDSAQKVDLIVLVDVILDESSLP